ncbi:MAG: T9SS type A sorting domain-containing protein [Thermoplasmata archaeon]|nr:MAG: T9SS type A sorting domain-containing protein [Thermoplasmata archaeon]MCD6222950.1 T9SS type A sorting domain-containing protein [Thermoplasmata archaeon]
MKLWQKIILLFFSIVLITFFIKWWMSYEPMEIYVINEGNESINVSIVLMAMDGREFFNSSFTLASNESRTFSNITNLAGNYFIKVKAGNLSEERKIKFGKYFERIEIVIGNEIIIRNERTSVHFLSTS